MLNDLCISYLPSMPSRRRPYQVFVGNINNSNACASYYLHLHKADLSLKIFVFESCLPTEPPLYHYYLTVDSLDAILMLKPEPWYTLQHLNFSSRNVLISDTNS